MVIATFLCSATKCHATTGIAFPESCQSHHCIAFPDWRVTIQLSALTVVMPAPLQKSPSISELSDKTPLEDFVTHRTRQTIEGLEEELVAAIYQQREWEQQIMSFNPQSDAPAGIVQSFTLSKLRVQEIELKLRQVRHSF